MNELKYLSQKEYERLLSGLASAIQTQRRFIIIVGAERVNEFAVRYKVKRTGDSYPYLIEVLSNLKCGNVYLNLGLVI